MAVAGRVLGAKNVSGSDDEKTAKIVAPGNPLASRETSLLRKGSWNKIKTMWLGKIRSLRIRYDA